MEDIIREIMEILRDLESAKEEFLTESERLGNKPDVSSEEIAAYKQRGLRLIALYEKLRAVIDGRQGLIDVDKS